MDKLSEPTPVQSTSLKVQHVVVRWIFLRGLGIVYLIAFASVLVQVLGLIGSQGILPAQLYLKQVAPTLGPFPFLLSPTVFWLDGSDFALRLVPILGIICSGLVIGGICTGLNLFLCWLFYLSIVTVGGDFLSFQWDVLLLEVGFLAIFFAHRKIFDLPRKALAYPEPSLIVLWFLRILLFKLMISSGCVKLLSGDVNWQNFDALHYHYWTQPLPTPLGWLAAQLPDWFQRFSVAAMFFIELIVPFFIFMPKLFRLAAAAFICFLQILILLTGNYTFFNLLTILLCIVLLDDLIVCKAIPKRLSNALVVDTQVEDSKFYRIWNRGKLACLALLIASINIGHSFPLAPEPLKYFAYIISPRCISNTYGLFAVMTTSRKEIIVEGSEDGVTWEPYSFFYKPGDVNRAPPWVAPYQPRLDWQMWFVALGTRRDSPWFSHFVLRLLQNSPDVRALLKSEPFKGKAPRYVRASLFNYEFTDINALTKSGAWWKRQELGLFFPDASLRSANEPPAVMDGE